MKYITALHLIEYYNNCVTFVGKLLCQSPQRCLTMYLLHWSEMENVQRYSGVFATCSIPALLTFGPYQGPLNMLLKTTDHKHLDFVLEVRLSDCYSNHHTYPIRIRTSQRISQQSMRIKTGSDTVTSAYTKIYGYERPHVSGYTAYTEISTLESVYRNLRIHQAYTADTCGR